MSLHDRPLIFSTAQMSSPSGSETPPGNPADAIIEEPRDKRPNRDSTVYVVQHSFHQTLPGDINHAIATITGTPVSTHFPIHDSNDRSTSHQLPLHQTWRRAGTTSLGHDTPAEP